jgi:hypothetical protein
MANMERKLTFNEMKNAFDQPKSNDAIKVEVD